MCAKRVIKSVLISSNEGFSRNWRYFQSRCESRGPVRHGRGIGRGGYFREAQTLQRSRYLPDERPSLELADDWVGDVAVVPTASAAGAVEGCSQVVLPGGRNSCGTGDSGRGVRALYRCCGRHRRFARMATVQQLEMVDARRIIALGACLAWRRGNLLRVVCRAVPVALAPQGALAIWISDQRRNGSGRMIELTICGLAGMAAMLV